MKKRRALLLIPVVLAVATAVLCLDFNIYKKQSRTISREPGEIVFSITTFDGKTESEPFIQCLGHAWVSVDNQSDHSVYIKGYEVKSGELLAISAWGVSKHWGVFFNLEPTFIRQYGRYVGRRSLSVNIRESQLKTVEDYIDRHNTWKFIENCSYWSIHLWNEVVGDDYTLKTPMLVYTPTRVQKAMSEFDCVETDMDFSRAAGIFFCRDGYGTELTLCS